MALLSPLWSIDHNRKIAGYGAKGGRVHGHLICLASWCLFSLCPDSITSVLPHPLLEVFMGLLAKVLCGPRPRKAPCPRWANQISLPRFWLLIKHHKGLKNGRIQLILEEGPQRDSASSYSTGAALTLLLCFFFHLVNPGVAFFCLGQPLFLLLATKEPKLEVGDQGPCMYGLAPSLPMRPGNRGLSTLGISFPCKNESVGRDDWFSNFRESESPRDLIENLDTDLSISGWSRASICSIQHGVHAHKTLGAHF